MIKINYFSSVFLVFFSFFVNAQNLIQPPHIQQITASEFTPYYFQYNGTPFYNDNWIMGSITLLSNETYNNLKIKYDIFKDEVQYYNEQENRMLLVDKSIVKKFTLNTNTKLYTLIKINRKTIDNSIQSGYYFLLVDGSVTLLGKKYKEISEYNDFSSARGKLGEYYAKQKYFILKSEEITRLILNRRLIAKHFPAKRKEILSFIRKNRYNVKNEDHLILIFNHINSL